MNVRLCLSLPLPVCLLVASSLWAQPSGGPYGPVQQIYAVPQDAAHVYYVAPEARPDGAGSSLEAPTTLETAIARVVSGDAIVLRGGIYRTGNLKLNQGVTLQPYAGEHPVIKGTKVATNWQALSAHVWRTVWPTLFPQKPADWWRREFEVVKTPLHRFNNDMVFVDGRMLQSAGWPGELTTNNFYIDYEHGEVFVGVNPGEHLIEITAHDIALIRTTGEVHGKKSDGRGPVIRGLTFTQYAYRAIEVEGKEPEGVADPATYGKDVIGSTFENVTISHCSRVAGYFRGDKTVFRNCLITDTSTEGIYIIASSDCLLEGNIFARNNVEHITGYFASAVKIFNQTHHVVCSNNVVIDQPESNGIWYDVGNHDGVFVNNWVEGCVDGFFFEISRGVICAGNVFVNCDKGMRVLNSADARVYHNTFVNTVASFERTERSAVGDHFGWHPSTGPDVDQREGHVFAGNLLAADENFHKALLRVEQSKTVCGRLTRPQMAQLDGNVYARSGSRAGQTLLVWGPVDGNDCVAEFESLEAFRKLGLGFEANSVEQQRASGSIFKSPELKNFRLSSPVNCPGAGILSADIPGLLGWAKPVPTAPGAYQVSE